MFIRTQPGGKAVRSQPAVAQICNATKKQGRNQIILTNLTPGTDFYIALGPGAAAGAAGVGGTWDFILGFGKPAVVIDNWTGIVTCDPVPAAGNINVSELLGSTYGST